MRMARKVIWVGPVSGRPLPAAQLDRHDVHTGHYCRAAAAAAARGGRVPRARARAAHILNV